MGQPILGLIRVCGRRMLAKGGHNRIAAKKRLPCDVYVDMKGHGSIARLCRCTRRVTNLNDARGDETSRARGRGTRRACANHLLCFTFSMAKGEEGHALRPGREVGGRRDSSLGPNRMQDLSKTRLVVWTRLLGYSAIRNSSER
jgi:hypothetical protein